MSKKRMDSPLITKSRISKLRLVEIILDDLKSFTLFVTESKLLVVRTQDTDYSALYLISLDDIKFVEKWLLTRS
jgi:hypothetical protein